MSNGNGAGSTDTIKIDLEHLCAAYRDDAERYRWLRDKADSNFVCWADLRDFGSYDAEDIDKKIDAARKGEGEV